MNKQLNQFAREFLKKNLAKLPEKNQELFKRMYSHEYFIDDEGHSYTGGTSKADLDKPINRVVDDMPEDKLDWAMQQVERSIQNLNPNSER